MPPKNRIPKKDNEDNFVETKKCYGCQCRLALEHFDFKNKSTGQIWAKCIPCRDKDAAKKKEAKSREGSNGDTRHCERCGTTKSLDLFTKKKNTGWYKDCTQCRIRLGK